MVFIFLIVVIIPNQGNRNSNDAIALAQTMEGALDETTNMLQKIRTLAVQASNGTNTDEDRKALQQEVTSLSTEINRIAEQTKFGGQQILAAAGKGLIAADKTISFQVGANKGDEIVFTALSSGFTISGIATVSGKLTLGAAADAKNTGLVKDNAGSRWSVSTAETAKKTLENIDKFIATVDSKRADLGAFQNHSPALFNFYF